MTSKKRILLIDDEPSLCRMLRLTIMQLGEYDVTVAFSGKEGVKKFKAEEFDLVVTDYAMPGFNGQDVLNAIKQHKPEVPVVLCSIYHDDQRILFGTATKKADGLLKKPIDRNELQQVMEDIFREGE